MKNEIYLKNIINFFYRSFKVSINNTWMTNFRNFFIKKSIKVISLTNLKYKEIVSLIIVLSLWVQVPQWEDDWTKCAIDIPDSSCYWYVKSPDNTFGRGFDFDNAPLFDVNGLNDIAKIDKETVLQKLQNKE